MGLIAARTKVITGEKKSNSDGRSQKYLLFNGPVRTQRAERERERANQHSAIKRNDGIPARAILTFSARALRSLILTFCFVFHPMTWYFFISTHHSLWGSTVNPKLPIFSRSISPFASNQILFPTLGEHH